MAERGLGVRELSRRVPCNPGHVSQLRSGQKRPSAQTARRLDEVLDAGGVLAALAPRPVARRAGGFVTPGGGFTDVPMQVRLTAFTAGQLDELIGHLDDQWHALVKTDNLLGPRHALAGVRELEAVAGLKAALADTLAA